MVKLSKAAYLDLASINPDDLNLTALESCVSNWQWFDKISREHLLSTIKEFDVVISNKVILDEAVISQAGNLKLICVSATGINNVDLAAAKKKGIIVCNVQAYATASVVQHVFALILNLATCMDDARLSVIGGEWNESQSFSLLGLPITELSGKTLGIVGYGELGSAVASVAKAFGMKVLISKRNNADSREGRITLHNLLPQVDVLSLHCPLDEKNKGLIGAAEFALMKETALLINTARGGLVDEQSLIDALVNQQIAGAALDVMLDEPPAMDNPLLTTDLPTLILTPHVAWASQEARQRLVDELVKNIQAFTDGNPRSCV